MAVKKFKSKLQKIGSWTIAVMPFDAFKLFGTRRAIRVRGTINGHPYSNISIMPKGDGTHFLTIRNEIRKAIGKEAGAIVEITLERDTSEMELPEELIEALEASEEARKVFEEMPPSHKRTYVMYIAESKKPETRIKRAVETVLKLESLFSGK